MNKYRAIKTEVDGIVFDSKAESIRYQELKLLLKAGEIKDLVLQPEFELQPQFKKGKVNYRSIKYIADFGYYDIRKGYKVIEDVKGVKTKEFKIKQKMFEYKYNDLHLTLVG
jgi:hypothetical protein